MGAKNFSSQEALVRVKDRMNDLHRAPDSDAMGHAYNALIDALGHWAIDLQEDFNQLADQTGFRQTQKPYDAKHPLAGMTEEEAREANKKLRKGPPASSQGVDPIGEVDGEEEMVVLTDDEVPSVWL